MLCPSGGVENRERRDPANVKARKNMFDPYSGIRILPAKFRHKIQLINTMYANIYIYAHKLRTFFRKIVVRGILENSKIST